MHMNHWLTHLLAPSQSHSSSHLTQTMIWLSIIVGDNQFARHLQGVGWRDLSKKRTGSLIAMRDFWTWTRLRQGVSAKTKTDRECKQNHQHRARFCTNYDTLNHFHKWYATSMCYLRVWDIRMDRSPQGLCKAERAQSSRCGIGTIHLGRREEKLAVELENTLCVVTSENTREKLWDL